jgi:SpoIIAA-like
MIELIEGMPPGTIGLRASGELSRDDYVAVLEPAIRAGVESGELRLLFALTDFDGLGHGAWIEDAKTGMQAWIRDHSAWKRFALVTDVEWVRKAVRMLAWMAPGEVEVFGLAQEAEARTWVSG